MPFCNSTCTLNKEKDILFKARMVKYHVMQLWGTPGSLRCRAVLKHPAVRSCHVVALWRKLGAVLKLVLSSRKKSLLFTEQSLWRCQRARRDSLDQSFSNMSTGHNVLGDLGKHQVLGQTSRVSESRAKEHIFQHIPK